MWRCFLLQLTLSMLNVTHPSFLPTLLSLLSSLVCSFVTLVSHCKGLGGRDFQLLVKKALLFCLWILFLVLLGVSGFPLSNEYVSVNYCTYLIPGETNCGCYSHYQFIMCENKESTAQLLFKWV